MKTIYKKKIYQGMVELRDYEVNRLITKNQPIRIFVGDEYMDLSVAQLKKGKVTNTQHSIIYPGQMYKLIGFMWEGKLYKEQDVEINMDIKQRLAEQFKAKYGTK